MPLNPDALRPLLVDRIDQKKQATGMVAGVVDSQGRHTYAYGTFAKGDPRAVGGDTLFANMYLAYEALSPKLKEVLERLHALNDRGAAQNNRNVDPARVAERLKLTPPVINPVVRVHPETGRKALYVSENVTTCFEGMTPEESRPLLEYLFAHSVRQEFIFRHRWQVHDLLMWDNRCTVHLAPPDYDLTQPRYMMRTTIAGTPLGRLYQS